MRHELTHYCSDFRLGWLGFDFILVLLEGLVNCTMVINSSAHEPGSLTKLKTCWLTQSHLCHAKLFLALSKKFSQHSYYQSDADVPAISFPKLWSVIFAYRKKVWLESGKYSVSIGRAFRNNLQSSVLFHNSGIQNISAVLKNWQVSPNSQRRYKIAGESFPKLVIMFTGPKRRNIRVTSQCRPVQWSFGGCGLV